MSTTYTEREVALNEVRDRNVRNIKQLENARNQFSVWANDFDAMVTDYTDVIADIDASFADSSSNEDPTVQQLYYRKERIKADFLVQRSRAKAERDILASIQAALAAGKSATAIKNAAIAAIEAL